MYKKYSVILGLLFILICGFLILIATITQRVSLIGFNLGWFCAAIWAANKIFLD